MRHERPYRPWTARELIDWAREYFEKHGMLPEQPQYKIMEGAPPLSAVYRVFRYKSTFDAVVMGVMHGDPYPEESDAPVRRRWRKTWSVTEQHALELGLDYLARTGEYPSVKALKTDHTVPSEATIRRKFLTIEKYHDRLRTHAEKQGLLLPRSTFKPQPKRARGPALRRKRFGAEGLAGSPETWQVDSAWLGGVDMAQDDRLVLSGPCECEGCLAYKNDPLRRCTCSNLTKEDCPACAAWRTRHPYLPSISWEEDQGVFLLEEV